MEHEYRPYQPIENYGVIGDLQTVALVGLDGSIDFMSFPRFDSPTLFASILDARKVDTSPSSPRWKITKASSFTFRERQFW